MWWHTVTHGRRSEGEKKRMEWVTNKRHTTAEHRPARAVQTLQADAHSSAASSRLNWRPRRFKWTRPFRRKTKSGFCAYAITFETQSTTGTLQVGEKRQFYTQTLKTYSISSSLVCYCTLLMFSGWVVATPRMPQSCACSSIECLAGIIFWSTDTVAAAAAAITTTTTTITYLTAITKLLVLSNSGILKLAGRGSAERRQTRRGAKFDAITVHVFF